MTTKTSVVLTAMLLPATLIGLGLMFIHIKFGVAWSTFTSPWIWIPLLLCWCAGFNGAFDTLTRLAALDYIDRH